MSDATALSNILATFAATYLFHSTILLSTCWVFLRLTRASSHFLVERRSDPGTRRGRTSRRASE